MNYKEVIESKYNRQKWQALLHDIFGNKADLWQTPYEISTNSDLSKQAFWLGTITLTDGETIAVYEVELSDSVDIERNRRGIRDMLLSEWRNRDAGAFMFCYRKNESVLRFSYVSEAWTFADDGSYTKESTDTKRFTYLLGEGHRSRTAIQQFEKLRDSKLSLKDLTKAFSVDAVSDMFFNEYKKNYEDIIEYTTGKRMVKVANKWEEKVMHAPCESIMNEFAGFPNPEKAVRDYVKKLMGRLVFLQFLQKKGWLGVPVNAEWGDGDPEFIQDLFAQCQDKDHFVDHVLEELFNDLNSERTNDLVSSAVGCNIRVPYLNGGLFEREATDETEFPLPAKYMQQMLDFFASYNFTIDENDPDDAEVGVDPEMLGRIFENLLEDNKDKGAFYTPKEIVSYMCRESLIAYLQTDIDDEEIKEAIRKFVTNHEKNDKLPANTDQKLKDVKICDPAIGSGAFPMGLLKELFQCRTALEGIDQSKAAEIKKHIIQQNIYGVDIERGAVDIARLRFWLSLIVDEEKPQALPNLDYKIVEGNSLITTFDGQNIDLEKGKGEARFRPSLINIQREKKKLQEEQKRFFALTGDEKYRSEIAIKNHILNTIWYQLDFEKHSWQDATVEQAGLFGALETGIRKKNKAQVAEFTPERQEVLERCEALMYQINDESKKLRERACISIPFFEWETVFSEIFDDESKKGFDIVVANPPYIGSKGNERVFHEVQSSSWGKFYFERWMDYFYFFFHKGIDILCNSGVLCFITTNYYYTATGAAKLRTNIKNWNINKIVDFGELKIFESALGQHNAITIIQKDNNTDITKIIKFKVNGYKTNSELSKMLMFDNNDVDRYYKNKKELYSGTDNQIIISHFNDSESGGNIIEKIIENTSPLSNYAFVTMGVVTLSDVVSNKHVEKFKIEGVKKGDGIYVLNNNELESLGLNHDDMIYIKPFYKNSDIMKFYTPHKTDKWLIYIKDEGSPIHLPEPLQNHFEKYKPIIVALKENFLKNEIAAGVVSKWLKNGNYFVLFTPKKESYFTTEKIVAPYRCKENIFSLSEESFFASKDVAYIIPFDKQLVKILLGILNSKLALYWLKTMGKMKGDVLELYAKPLNDIPIKIPNNKEVFISLVDKIIDTKKNNKGDTASMEVKLDILIYHLYNLTYDDILIVDPNTQITRSIYES